MNLDPTNVIGLATLLALLPGIANAQGLSREQLQRSRWDTSYVAGEQRVRAIMKFDGTSGKYQLVDGRGTVYATGELTDVGYDRNPDTGAFAIRGRWSLSGQSGNLTIQSDRNDVQRFSGMWTRGGQSGEWTGSLIVAARPAQGGANAAQGQVRYGPWQFNDAKGYYFRVCSFPAGGQQYLILYPNKPQWVYWFNPSAANGPVFWCACPTIRHPEFGADARNGKDQFLMAKTKGRTIDATTFPEDVGPNIKSGAKAKDKDGSEVDLGCPPPALPADLP